MHHLFPLLTLLHCFVSKTPQSKIVIFKAISILYELHFTLYIHFQNSCGPYICSYPGCGAAIKRRSHFNWHMKKHLGIYPYNCPYCDKGVNNTGMLKEHLKTHHTGINGYHCIKCKLEFPNVHQLRAHLQNNICTG